MVILEGRFGRSFCEVILGGHLGGHCVRSFGRSLGGSFWRGHFVR